jgi:hypothetical protein
MIPFLGTSYILPCRFRRRNSNPGNLQQQARLLPTPPTLRERNAYITSTEKGLSHRSFVPAPNDDNRYRRILFCIFCRAINIAVVAKRILVEQSQKLVDIPLQIGYILSRRQR